MSGILQMFSYFGGIVKKWLFEKTYSHGVDWSNISGDYTGETILAADKDVSGNITLYQITDSGQTFTKQSAVLTGTVLSIKSSRTMDRSIVLTNDIYLRLTKTGVWTKKSLGSKDWTSLSTSTDGVRAYAVANNRVNYTVNSGAIWSAYNNYTCYDVACSNDGIKAIVACTSGVLVTTNSGSSWSFKNISSTIVRSVAMSSDGLIMYAIDGAGAVYLSTNTGGTWVLRSTVSGYILREICCSSNGNVVYIRSDNRILYSADSGANWTHRIVSTSATQTNVYKTICCSGDGATIIVSYNSNYIYKSTNYGGSFSSIYVGLDVYSSVSCSSDASVIAVCGPGGAMRVSINGGTNWDNKSTSTIRKVISVGSDGTKMYCGVTNGTMLKSVDTGNTWTEYLTGVYLKNVVYMDDSGVSLLGVSYNSYIFRSEDYGQSWNLKNFVNVTALGASGNSQYFAAGAVPGTISVYDSNGNIVSTTSPSSSRVAEICFSHDASIILTADEGIDLSTNINGRIRLSRDYGISWSIITPFQKQWVRMACSRDANTILAISKNGTSPSSLFLSRDLGVNWYELEKRGPMTAVTCSDNGEIIYLTESVGNISASYDGGSSWATVAPSRQWQHIETSSDGKYVIACSAESATSGAIFYSEDYGKNWLQTNIFKEWRRVTLSDDGTRSTAIAYNDLIYNGYYS